MVHHPNTGLNLLMSGTDLLDGHTDTPVVSSRSEPEQGILYTKIHIVGVVTYTSREGDMSW